MVLCSFFSQFIVVEIESLSVFSCSRYGHSWFNGGFYSDGVLVLGVGTHLFDPFHT